jgi:undecaprenyl-diphosphatase
VRPFIQNFDRSVSHLVSQLPRSLDPFFLFVTQLGDPITVCVIAFCIGVWAFFQRSISLVAAAAAIPLTLLVGYCIKLIFERARPAIDLGYSLRLDSFSFPSGHSSGSMIAYGLLAYLAWCNLPPVWNVVVAITLGLVPFFVGLSRIYLGVHYPSDVLAGWLLGLAALLIVIFVIKPHL